MKVLSFQRLHFGDKVKWDEMFDSEGELIEIVKNINVVQFQDKGCKGYSYIEGFQRTLSSGNDLSRAQLTQLKRLAKEVYKYHMNL